MLANVSHKSVRFLLAFVHLMNGRIAIFAVNFLNECGVIDMGCLHDSLPGGRPISVESFSKPYEEFAGAEIPASSRLSLMEIIDGARAGTVKAAV